MAGREDLNTLIQRAVRGYYRIRPVYAPGVDPLSTDESGVVGFDLIRAGRRIRISLDQFPPEVRASVRDTLLSVAGERLVRRLSTIFDPDLSPRDSLRMTITYLHGRPFQIIFTAPGVAPQVISARDFLPFVKGIQSLGYNTAIAHLKVSVEGQIKDLWVIGSRDAMRYVGYMIQQGQLPLDVFEQRGPVLFMNADKYARQLPQLPTKPVEYVRRGIWVYSP